MNIKYIATPICLLLLVACKDKTPEPTEKQYSIWIVNNHDTFRTNNVDSSVDCNPDHSYCRAVLSSHDSYNRFSLAFQLDYFPSDGQYQLYTPPIGSGSVPFAIKIYYNDHFFYHTMSRIDTVYASSVNNKPSYSMPPTWFINYDNPTGDSVIIQGTFKIP